MPSFALPRLAHCRSLRSLCLQPELLAAWTEREFAWLFHELFSTQRFQGTLTIKSQMTPREVGFAVFAPRGASCVGRCTGPCPASCLWGALLEWFPHPVSSASRVCIYVYMYAIYVCVCICIYIYIYMYMYMCICMLP